jgi:hypothetical protein
MNAVVIHVPQAYSREDTRDWTNRSEVRSTSSNRFYIGRRCRCETHHPRIDRGQKWPGGPVRAADLSTSLLPPANRPTLRARRGALRTVR